MSKPFFQFAHRFIASIISISLMMPSPAFAMQIAKLAANTEGGNQTRAELRAELEKLGPRIETKLSNNRAEVWINTAAKPQLPIPQKTLNGIKKLFGRLAAEQHQLVQHKLKKLTPGAAYLTSLTLEYAEQHFNQSPDVEFSDSSSVYRAPESGVYALTHIETGLPALVFVENLGDGWKGSFNHTPLIYLKVTPKLIQIKYSHPEYIHGFLTHHLNKPGQWVGIKSRAKAEGISFDPAGESDDPKVLYQSPLAEFSLKTASERIQAQLSKLNYAAKAIQPRVAAQNKAKAEFERRRIHFTLKRVKNSLGKAAVSDTVKQSALKLITPLIDSFVTTDELVNGWAEAVYYVEGLKERIFEDMPGMGQPSYYVDLYNNTFGRATPFSIFLFDQFQNRMVALVRQELESPSGVTFGRMKELRSQMWKMNVELKAFDEVYADAEKQSVARVRKAANDAAVRLLTAAASTPHRSEVRFTKTHNSMIVMPEVSRSTAFSAAQAMGVSTGSNVLAPSLVVYVVPIRQITEGPLVVIAPEKVQQQVIAKINEGLKPELQIIPVLTAEEAASAARDRAAELQAAGVSVRSEIRAFATVSDSDVLTATLTKQLGPVMFYAQNRLDGLVSALGPTVARVVAQVRAELRAAMSA